MGNANSNPVRNLDKRSVRRIYRKNFKRHISAYVLEGDLEKQISSFQEELAEEKESKEMVQDRGTYVYVRKRPIFDRERKTKEFDDSEDVALTRKEIRRQRRSRILIASKALSEAQRTYFSSELNIS